VKYERRDKAEDLVKPRVLGRVKPRMWVLGGLFNVLVSEPLFAADSGVPRASASPRVFIQSLF
jgi:hypothetical protein